MTKIPEKALEKVLILDCREEESIRRLEKALMKLPFIKSEDDMTVSNMEEKIVKIEEKHGIHLSYIMRMVNSDIRHYSAMVMSKRNEEFGKWLRTIYAVTIWEATAKSLFFMYYYIQKKNKNNGKGS